MEELTREWEVACLRVEDYLRAWAVEPRERLLALTLSILDEARRQAEPSLSPVEKTMRLVVAKTDAWFERLAGSAEAAPRARVAFFASGRTDLFLADDLPEDFVREIRTAGIQAGPALEFQSLVRREVDYGAMEGIVRETIDRFSWGHVLRAFALWTVIFFLSWGAYLRFFK